MKFRALTTTLLVLSAVAAHAAEQPLFELHESVRSPDARSDWRTDTLRTGRSGNRPDMLRAQRLSGPGAGKPVLRSSAELIADSAPRGKDGRVLVEIRFNPSQRSHQRASLRSVGAEIHTDVTANLVEAWIAPRQIKALQQSLDGAVIRPARLVRPSGRRAGTVTSEGVAQSGADVYHGYGADGSGQIIAVIDSGFSDWSALQASGDWPANAKLQRFEVSGSTIIDCSTAACPTFEDDDHGSNTVSIAFDTAPGATFRVYKTRTLGEWYEATLHASDPTLHADGRHADVISASLSAPLDGVGDGSACPPNQPAPCGTIAEAAEIAQSRRSFMVNSASNYREDHWGGLYQPMAGGASDLGDLHDFGGGNLNVSPFCVPDGFPIRVEMFWDDWTDVDHDYDLELYRRTAEGGWTIASASYGLQSGNPATQSPQEFISFTASGSSAGCSSGSNYAVAILRWDAPTNRNIQLFSNVGVGVNVPERSLGFPADSAAVFAVGALDLTIDDSTPAWYSSEGPVLAPGGGLPDASNPPAVAKPDGMSFSPVSTSVAGGTTFGGTSAAAAHAAGLAAVLNQIRRSKPIVTNGNCALAIREGMEWLGQFNGNDLNTAGHDTATGYGRMRVFECMETVDVPENRWVMVSPSCQRLDSMTAADVFADSTLGVYGTDWFLYEVDAVSQSYRYVSISDTLEVEKGYWLGSFDAATVSFSGVKPDITESIAVPVFGEDRGGLGTAQMISNPRRIAIDWNEFQFAYDGIVTDFFTAVTDGKIRPLIWMWNAESREYDVYNGIQFEGTIPPGGAFWIKARDNIEVRVPSPNALEAARSAAGTRAHGRSSFGDPVWESNISVSLGSTSSEVRIGQHPASTIEFDLLDAEVMAGIGRPDIALTIESAASRSVGRSLMRDFRAPAATDVWTFELEVTKPGVYAISWDGNAQALRNGTLILPDGSEASASRRGNTVSVFLESGSHSLGWRYDES